LGATKLLLLNTKLYNTVAVMVSGIITFAMEEEMVMI
jgi:hypothetical protein